jgi:hypothetical protein
MYWKKDKNNYHSFFLYNSWLGTFLKPPINKFQMNIKFCVFLKTAFFKNNSFKFSGTDWNFLQTLNVTAKNWSIFTHFAKSNNLFFLVQFFSLSKYNPPYLQNRWGNELPIYWEGILIFFSIFRYSNVAEMTRTF